MQEHGELLSYRFTVRHYSLLKKELLNGLRQIAPNPSNSLSQSANEHVLGFAGLIHGSLL
jgi:hypothetical protein